MPRVAIIFDQVKSKISIISWLQRNVDNFEPESFLFYPKSKFLG